ncbi:molybdopterin-guanine dinucleotide biosynthesis protein MobB [Streptacidiphilus rugosus]|uniref:molybdopterin-guanine dinucleotide biosynthesis protein MobB n=1 Tax=Streptacidiphilus rugosus TaxID=405783 RepID=UPI00056B0AC5|nr:molybdopterin-guanine dinucleotide biosynthesis protein MobB [Streptacidiphilus rugosus]
MRLEDLNALQATTIRADLSPYQCQIADGTGAEGDVIAVRVTDPGGITALVDYRENQHPVTAGTVLLGVLANRDSTTHASGGIPREGLAIVAGTQLAWLGGQSGLIGTLDWSPAPRNTLGQQAAGTVEAIGLVHTQIGTLNIAHLARTPGAQTGAGTRLLVVAGTAAEVGKTTLAGRLISHLTQTGLRVVAVKPTGSGGITDSLAHRRAGALASYDLVDCGLPSSYTDATRYEIHIQRCLAYAVEHRPDLVLVELGGDLVWGNNDTFLRQPGIRERIADVLCVCGDATGALGTHTFMHQAGLEDLPVTYAPSYTRNPATFTTRVQSLLGPHTPVLGDTTDASLAHYLDALTVRNTAACEGN